MTCNNKSDSMLSSSVDENDLINFGGKSRMKPIVSLSKTSFHKPVSGSIMYTFPTCVHSVANNLFSARTHFFVNQFNNDDLPALVYHTIPIVGIHFFVLPSLWSLRIFSYSLSLASIFNVFSCKCLFILSVFVSPIPLVAHQPLPLLHHCLESSIPIQKILGHICLIDASSICNLDSILSACLPKIFRIKSTLSRASALIGRSNSFK